MALSKSCDELSAIHFSGSLARRDQDAHGNIVMGTARREVNRRIVIWSEAMLYLRRVDSSSRRRLL